MGCQRALEERAQQVVNNFAANQAATVSDWLLGFISVLVSLVARAGGPGLLTTSRFNDFELYRPARRAGLDPLTTTQEGVSVYQTTFLYCRRRVKPIAGATITNNIIMNNSHPYDLVIGLDRSDKKADLCLIDTHTTHTRLLKKSSKVFRHARMKLCWNVL